MGTSERIGHIDFFVGQSYQTLGSAPQYGCPKIKENFSWMFQGCSHSKAHEVVDESITNKEAYHAHVLCKGKEGGCAIHEELPKNSKKVFMGYWWSGDDNGSY